jgi:hypothetical protein
MGFPDVQGGNSVIRRKLGLAVLLLAAALVGTAAATATPSTTAAPKALALPSPLRFVSNLDLDCFRTTPYTPPAFPKPLTLSHLNPVLAEQARWTIDALGERTQLCSPVAKNQFLPPEGVLEFVRFVDLSCYKISGPTLNFPLVLDQLNPVLGAIPRKKVLVMAPEQLCLPVIKNNSIPSPEVLDLVKYIDLVCYREDPPVQTNFPVTLTQLNPVLANIPPAAVRMTANRQLCVPVRKNDQKIPDDVLKIVQYVDLEKYDLNAPAINPVSLRLRHINPLLEGLPIEPATLVAHQQLAVPVAKNEHIPPA